MTTYISWDQALGRYRLQRGYDETWIEKFKVLLPRRDRSWDAGGKAWLFAEPWVNRVQKFCADYGDEVFIASRPREETRSGGNGRTGAGTLRGLSPAHADFIACMDDEAFAAAFRSLAKRKHPDTGGSNEEMQHINDSYRAMKEGKKR